jgi:hypothetical protein
MYLRTGAAQSEAGIGTIVSIANISVLQERYFFAMKFARLVTAWLPLMYGGQGM